MATHTCARRALIAINLLVVLIGTALLCAGIYYRFDDSVAEDGRSVVDAIPDMIETLRLEGDKDKKFEREAAQEDMDGYVQLGAIVVCCVGLFFVLLGLYGYIGVCIKSKTLLIVYVIVLIVLILIQAILVTMVFSGQFKETSKKILRISIEKKFVAIDSTELDSVIWNVAQLHFQCCGVDSYRDYDKAKRWDRSRDIQLTEEDHDEEDHEDHTVRIKLLTPFSCCKVQGMNFRNVSDTCAVTPNQLNSNKNTGCFAKVSQEMEEYKTYFFVFVAVMLALQLTLIILAILLLESWNEVRVAPVSEAGSRSTSAWS